MLHFMIHMQFSDPVIGHTRCERASCCCAVVARYLQRQQKIVQVGSRSGSNPVDAAVEQKQNGLGGRHAGGYTMYILSKRHCRALRLLTGHNKTIGLRIVRCVDFQSHCQAGLVRDGGRGPLMLD